MVEGRTERDSAAAFLKRWLDPQLREPVGIQTVSFDGYADLVRKMPTKAQMHLRGPKQREIVAVYGLLDLYGPTFYPADKTTAEERFAWGKEFFENEVSDPRFRVSFAVHEFEAWLLSQPEIFPVDVRQALSPASQHPEQVNFNRPPAKLLEQIYLQKTNRGYKKTTYGKQLFAKLDPIIATSKCPYLKLLLEEMLDLCRKAGL